MPNPRLDLKESRYRIADAMAIPDAHSTLIRPASTPARLVRDAVSTKFKLVMHKTAL